MAISQTNITIAGAALVALGLLIRYGIGRRRFYRRNVAGLQTFSRYKWALLISLAEILGILLGQCLHYHRGAANGSLPNHSP